jgi:hypothetical protein
MENIESALRLLSELEQKIGDIRTALTASDGAMPTDEERAAMQHARRDMALQYWRENGEQIPQTLNYAPQEIHRAGILMGEKGIDFDRAISLVRTGR